MDAAEPVDAKHAPTGPWNAAPPAVSHSAHTQSRFHGEDEINASHTNFLTLPRAGSWATARTASQCESECPGYGGAPDTFYGGTLKGVGRIYQHTFIDTYAKVGFAKLYTEQTPITAADLLTDRVPFFEQHDSALSRYTTERPHQGRWCYGKTPMQTFLEPRAGEGEADCLTSTAFPIRVIRVIRVRSFVRSA